MDTTSTAAKYGDSGRDRVPIPGQDTPHTSRADLNRRRAGGQDSTYSDEQFELEATPASDLNGAVVERNFDVESRPGEVSRQV